MGAREEILAAARALTRRGLAPFSPAQVIAEVRARGSQYPDSTLRTFIVSAMCVNAPNHHAVQYSDLYRLGRGQYRLHETGSQAPEPARETPRASPAVDAAGQKQPFDATADWRWEGNVQAAVVRHLVARGWNIRRVADTASRERGADIEARREGEQLLVEVKGYPGDTYVRGPKEGQTKAGGAALQARTYFAGALLSGMLLRSERPEARVLLAFPDVETYRSLTRRTQDPLRAAGIEVWLFAEDGSVPTSGHHLREEGADAAVHKDSDSS